MLCDSKGNKLFIYATRDFKDFKITELSEKVIKKINLMKLLFKFLWTGEMTQC